MAAGFVGMFKYKFVKNGKLEKIFILIKSGGKLIAYLEVKVCFWVIY